MWLRSSSEITIAIPLISSSQTSSSANPASRLTDLLQFISHALIRFLIFITRGQITSAVPNDDHVHIRLLNVASKSPSLRSPYPIAAGSVPVLWIFLHKSRRWTHRERDAGQRSSFAPKRRAATSLRRYAISAVSQCGTVSMTSTPLAGESLRDRPQTAERQLRSEIAFGFNCRKSLTHLDTFSGSAVSTLLDHETIRMRTLVSPG